MGALDVNLKDNNFSNPKKWKKTFRVLVQLLESQKLQLEALEEEREVLLDRIRVQCERWASDVRSLESQIDQMQREVKSSEMARLFGTAKADLTSRLKKKNDIFFKLKLAHAEDELADFKTLFDILSHRSPSDKGVSPEIVNDAVNEKERAESSSKIASSRKRSNPKGLEDEVRRLKCEYEKLSTKRRSELTALSAEKDFAWNQYKQMEENYASQLQMKNNEAEQAKGKVDMLLESIDRLESLNSEKDDQISKLKTSFTELEAATLKKDEEISRLLKELETAKGSNHDSSLPVLRHCTNSESTALQSDSKKDNSQQTRRNKKEGSSSSSYQGTRSRKRNSAEIVTVVETPKLFTSDFKIPKLKTSSSSSGRFRA